MHCSPVQNLARLCACCNHMLVHFVFVGAVAFSLCLAGCHNVPTASPASQIANPHSDAIAANKAFLDQATYDPWVLTRTAASPDIPLYMSNGKVGKLIGSDSQVLNQYHAGKYVHGQIVGSGPVNAAQPVAPNPRAGQTLDMRTGTLTPPANGATAKGRRDWSKMWRHSDIAISGDPQAQQATHANLFYLLSSTYPGSTDSIPPMGLSSGAYSGHIFWDADVWMLPALIVQHPEYAKPIVAYRFKLLKQAEKNAKAHGYKGAEFPWESAAAGKEVAPPEFAKERHITADVAFAAWQYYLWTGDKHYLAREGWPLLAATAQYWASRVVKGADGRYHIKSVLSPDETAGLVNDDAYTNSVVKYNLLAAQAAAKVMAATPNPMWSKIANSLYLSIDQQRGIIAENDAPLTDRFSAKQADTLLLLHPLGFSTDPETEGKMLDFYTAHTMKFGPAMTSSIEAIVAARLGRAQQSLYLFHDSYQPFMRAPWAAFSEKRTTNNVYFLTGMAGCVQSVLYGFAGLQAVSPWEAGVGTKIMQEHGVGLYCDPHLPPGWTGLTVKGVRFHGKMFDLKIGADNTVTVTSPMDQAQLAQITNFAATPRRQRPAILGRLP